jgi:hypothetical protein
MHTHLLRAGGDSSLRYLLITQLMLLSSVAFAGDKLVSCELVGKSVVSHSSSGLAQVSNLGLIQIECHVAARPFPTKPGEASYLLKVATVAYQISPDGSKKLVPSEVNQTGGGYDTETESVFFDAHIPLETTERDDEARRFLAKIEKSVAPEEITEEGHQRMLEWAREVVNPERVGHFQLKCRVLDGDRIIGVGVIELEVLFKGRVSDFGLHASPPV